MQSDCHLWRQSSGEHDYGAESIPFVVVADRYYIALILRSRFYKSTFFSSFFTARF